MIKTIIPAQPDWFVAVLIDSRRDRESFAYDPVIAWDIWRAPNEDEAYDKSVAPLVSHEVVPVTAAGNPSAFLWWAIKRPDGKFRTPDGAVHISERDAIEHLQVCRDDFREDQAALKKESAKREPAT